MNELYTHNQEINQGPKGPIFYLIEKKSENIELVKFLQDSIELPEIQVHDYPLGEEHSEAIVHDICIKYAKNGQKEEVVEDHEEMLERYAAASGLLRKGGLILQVNPCGIFDIDVQFIKDLDELFPQ